MATLDTKERILDAAEGLFASRGFSETSLRNVIQEAGVNLAAVHYHFGSREGLIQAVFARRFDPVNAERFAALDRLEAAGRIPSVPEVLDSFLAPAIRLGDESGDRGATLLRLVTRVHTDSVPAVRELLRDEFKSVFERYLAAFSRAIPDVSEQELATRFHFIISAMATAFAARADPSSMMALHVRPNDEQLMDALKAFCVAGLLADSAWGAAANAAVVVSPQPSLELES